MKAITTRTLSATNTRGTRIRATDGDGNSRIVAWDHSQNAASNHHAAFLTLCYAMNWHGFYDSGALLVNGREVGTVWVWIANPQGLKPRSPGFSEAAERE